MLRNSRFQVFVLMVMLAGPSLAQVNSDSPYSRFGLGMVSSPGFTKSRAMGGVGIAMRDNNQINYVNPASYTALDSMSFLFDFGLMAQYTYTETSSGNDDFVGMNMDHLAMSFPITKWWGASIGMVPYTKVGYSIKQEDYISDIGFIDYLYTGNGGVNQFYFGTSFDFFKSLSVGINFKYLHGAIDLSKTAQYPFNPERSYTEVTSRTIVSDFILDMGLQYSLDLNEKYNITLGVIFDNESKVSAENSIVKRNLFPGTAAAINDSTVLDPTFVLDNSTRTGNIVIPTNFGAGVSFNYEKKLRIGIDYYQQDWSKATFFVQNEPLTKSNSFLAGAEFIPEPAALKGYLKRIAYRMGGHYQNSYLMFEGEQLKDYGISFGVGLPLRNTKSSFNLAIEGGRKGTLENELIRESYMFLSFSVTLHDFWFVKRKFD